MSKLSKLKPTRVRPVRAVNVLCDNCGHTRKVHSVLHGCIKVFYDGGSDAQDCQCEQYIRPLPKRSRKEKKL